jgi:hypothetical protein
MQWLPLLAPLISLALFFCCFSFDHNKTRIMYKQQAARQQQAFKRGIAERSSLKFKCITDTWHQKCKSGEMMMEMVLAMSTSRIRMRIKTILKKIVFRAQLLFGSFRSLVTSSSSSLSAFWCMWRAQLCSNKWMAVREMNKRRALESEMRMR